MKSVWQVKPEAPEDFVKQFPEYPDFVLQLLWDRGIKNQQEIDDFFNPDYETDLYDPFLMKGMKEAVRRLEQAVQNQEKIVIYGDYDTDGICASVILYETFRALGDKNIDVYIPDRFREGYGLNINSIEEIARSGAKVLITVDCGITDVDEVALANSRGLDVIITDHHLVPENPPRALAIVDARQKDDAYPFKWLTGTGVAFKLVQALLKSRRQDGREALSPGWEKWLLDLVALATIADIQPLLGENRTLVKYGLIVLEKTRRLGLKELIKISGLTGSELTSWKVGFILVPRINAAGRIKHADIGFQILITESADEAAELARQLDSYNKERQRQVEDIVKALKENLGGLLTTGVKLPKLIFDGSEHCSAGTTGLVASKLKEEYHRPAMIYCSLAGQIRGTGRSIPGFNLVEAMEKCHRKQADLFVEFGGHAMAAGFTVKSENLERFKNLLQEIANEEIGEEAMAPKLDIDLEAPVEKFNWEFYEWLQKFEPLGEKNEEPVFLLRGLEVMELRSVGNGGKHLKMKLKLPGGKVFPAIGFGLGEAEKKLAPGAKIDAVFELSVDEWNGNRELQLKIFDLKPAKQLP